MKIVQIAPVVENHSFPNMDEVYPNEEATIYGLGDDGKLYVWGCKKSTYVKTEPTEENEYSKGHYDREYGWLLQDN